MEKISFSWAGHFSTVDSLVDFVKTSEPEAILAKIYGDVLSTIESDPEYKDYYLKTAKKVKKCCRKLRREIKPEILYGNGDSSEIDPGRFKEFIKHILVILGENGLPLFNPEKQEKLTEFFCSFIQNQPEDLRYFNPPFDYVPADAPIHSKPGSPLFQKCQSTFLFYYLVDVLKQYLYISQESSKLFIRLRPQDGSNPPNQHKEPITPEIREKVLKKEPQDHQQPSTSKESLNLNQETEGALKSPSGLTLLPFENRLKVSFSWKKCLEEECSLFEEMGYGTVSNIINLIYGQELFDGLPNKIKNICLTLAGKVRYAHLQLFNEDLLDLLYPGDSLELHPEKFFNFIHKTLKIFTGTYGFPFLSLKMVDRVANFLTVFLQNSPAVVRNFYPSPLLFKDFDSFSKIKFPKGEVDKMLECHTLFVFHYITKFIKKFIRIRRSEDRLELRPRDTVAVSIYFSDVDMIQYKINHPNGLKLNKKATNAPKETLNWSEYLQQPCTLFEEVSSLTPKGLIELIFGNNLLENAMLNTKEVCTSIVRRISKYHSHLYVKNDLDLLYYKDSLDLRRGPIFHFLLQCLKRLSDPIKALQGLFATADVHQEAVFYSNLLFLPVDKTVNLDLSPILLPKRKSDFAKKEDQRLVAELHKKLTIFMFKYILSFFRKFVALSKDGKKLILKTKNDIERSIYPTGNARKYYSSFQVKPTRKLLNQPESMIKQILTSSAETFAEKMVGEAVFQALKAQGRSILREKALKFLISLKKLVTDFQDPECLQKNFNKWPKTPFHKFVADNLSLLLSMITVPFTEAFDDLLPHHNRGELNKNICSNMLRDFYNGTKVLKEEDFDFNPVECPFIDSLPSMIQENLQEEALDIQQAMYFNTMYFYAFYVMSWIMRFGELQKDEKDLLKQTLRACSQERCRRKIKEIMLWISEPVANQQEEERIDDDMVILGVYDKVEKEPLWTMDIGSSDDEDDEEEEAANRQETLETPVPQEKETPTARKIKEEPQDDLWVIGSSKRKKKDDERSFKKIKQEPESGNAAAGPSDVQVKKEKEQPKIKEEPVESTKKKGKENQNQPTTPEAPITTKKIKEEPKDKEEEDFWVVYASKKKKKLDKNEVEPTPGKKIKLEPGIDVENRKRAAESEEMAPKKKKKARNELN